MHTGVDFRKDESPAFSEFLGSYNPKIENCVLVTEARMTVARH